MRNQLTQMRASMGHLLHPPPETADTKKDIAIERTNPGYIRWMQKALNRTMKTNLVPTGTLGLRTRQAIRAFQKKEGLPENGLTSFRTEKRLIERSRIQPPRQMRTGPQEEEAVDPISAGFENLNNRRTAMNRQILYGSDFEFSPQSENGMHEGMFAEFESAANRCRPFTPVAMEKPGGGRVKNKTAPRVQDIVNVTGASGGKVPLHRLTAAALNALQCAAAADGIKAPLLQPTSGFRDPKHQARLWANALLKYKTPQEARRWVAPPGSSAHQSGRAIDFFLGDKNASGNVANLRKLRAYHWMLKNARRFGFYPYEAEPWHWEYNPPASGGAVDQEWGWSSIANWFKPSTSTTSPITTYSPSVSSGSYAVPTSPGVSIRNNAVAIANAEWNRWRQSSIKESDPGMRSVLEDYWLTGTGSKRYESSWWSAVPWSAAFISWVMKKAGAGSDFSYSASHSVYTAAAKENALQNNSNLFKAYRITQVAPRLGDIVCKDRGSGATYDNIKPGMSTHCDIVTSVQPNSISVVGGNLSDSVSKNPVTTDSSGKINAKDYFAVIRVGT